MYPSTAVDADGRALSGDSAFVLHFTKAEIPPVNAFWSMTLYDADGYFVANPINRYAIGDRDRLTFNEDGSLDIYIQAARPSEGRVRELAPGTRRPVQPLVAPLLAEAGGAVWIVAPARRQARAVIPAQGL